MSSKASLAQTLRIQLEIPVPDLIHVSGCVSLREYQNCENYRSSPPLGWAPVFDEMILDLASYMKTHSYPPHGVTVREARWLLAGKYKENS